METRTERRFSEGLASPRLGESRLTLTGHCPYSVTWEWDQARCPGREPHLEGLHKQTK